MMLQTSSTSAHTDHMARLACHSVRGVGPLRLHTCISRGLRSNWQSGMCRGDYAPKSEETAADVMLLMLREKWNGVLCHSC